MGCRWRRQSLRRQKPPSHHAPSTWVVRPVRLRAIKGSSRTLWSAVVAVRPDLPTIGPATTVSIAELIARRIRHTATAIPSKPCFFSAVFCTSPSSPERMSLSMTKSATFSAKVLDSFLASIIAAIVTMGTAAAGSYRVCIGDDGNKCPVAHTAFFGCGTTADAAAVSLCTVTSGATKTVLPYQIVSQDWHDGGHCGYSWFEVNCPTPHLSVRACIGEQGIGDKCPVSHEAFFGCGTSEATAANSICTISDGSKKTILPHQITPQGNHEGDHCGYDWFQVSCQQ